MPDANDALQISISGFFMNCIHFFTMESVASSNRDEYFPLRFFTSYSDTG